jgi:hypothetical protein
MATKKVYDLAVAVGKYTSEGKEKNRYQNIGVMLERDDGGRFMILETWFNPAGIPHEPGKGIMVSMFEPRQREVGKAGPDDHFEDDIPF